MATTNRERVTKAMDLLKDGLSLPVSQMLAARFGSNWFETYRTSHPSNWAESWGKVDVQSLLKYMNGNWNDVFAGVLGKAERAYVNELVEVRNAWAHQEPFDYSDTERALDTTARLLTAVSATEQADEVTKEREQVIRTQQAEKARRVQRNAASNPLNMTITEGYRPWREVITPHRDVQRGEFQLAEFAADLGQVARGEGKTEYADPIEFFRRTFLTDGLQSLIRNALLRLGGKGGDPVIELKTNFGGGKTHSMLALYHITSDASLEKLPGLEGVIADAKAAGVDIDVMPHRVVLVGTALSAGQARVKDDGTVVRTIWGELAYQLGGTEAYARIEDSDRSGLNPGTDLLVQLFEEYSPTLILIDEWVAFIRQLYQQPASVAGSFESNLSFAQSLTEAVRQSPGVLLVASLPSSDIETGGDGGREALARLSNTFSRMQASWRPATTEESFEIVRRRLFEPIEGAAKFAARDATVRAYVDLYQKNSGNFPSKVQQSDYKRRLEIAYPIHPEVFDKLYGAWSTLERFQRTRGVLRLMATVIQTLWQRNDAGLLILPSSIPMDDHDVIEELTRYLDNAWKPVIETDVDGERALPIQIDRENSNFGRVSATRRVARAIYLGSAPTLRTANQGIEYRDILLGSVQPGEPIATFGDALRSLANQATHLYVDRDRYWFDTQPSVTRTAQDRAVAYKPDDIFHEVAKRLKKQTARGDFYRVHPLPASTSDVADDEEIGLVILDPEQTHSRGQLADAPSPAVRAADQILNKRGESPRLFRNALIFAAADATKWADLESAVRQYLAWSTIANEWQTLNLDAYQQKQAQTQAEDHDKAVTSRIGETYQWVLLPYQPDKTGGYVWEEARTSGEGDIAQRVSRRLKNDASLYTDWNGTSLRQELDRIPLWRGNHVSLRQLADDFAKYLYLPKLKDSSVLTAAAANGLGNLLWSTETYALADSDDENANRYRGLLFGQHRTPTLDQVLVKPEIALAQIEADAAISKPPIVGPTGDGVTPPSGETSGGRTTVAPPPLPIEKKPRRYTAQIQIDPTKLATEAQKIAQEVLNHLVMVPGSTISVSLEIDARAADSFSDDVRRVVDENSRTLKFTAHEFEES